MRIAHIHTRGPATVEDTGNLSSLFVGKRIASVEAQDSDDGCAAGIRFTFDNGEIVSIGVAISEPTATLGFTTDSEAGREERRKMYAAIAAKADGRFT